MAPDGSRPGQGRSRRRSDIYLARVDWTPDGGALLVQRESRDQKRLDMLARRSRHRRARPILFSETSRDLDQPPRQSATAARRQPDLDLGALGLLAPLPLPRRPLDPAHPRRLGGRPGRRRRRARAGASTSPAIATRRSSSQLYWVDLDRPGTPHRVTEAGWWNNGRDGRRRDAAPRHPLEPDPAGAGLSRRRVRAGGSPGSRRTGSTPPIPMRRSSPAMSRRRFGTIRGRRRHRAPLPDARRRRASRAGAIRSSSRSMAARAPAGRRPAPGATRSSNIWSTAAGSSSRSTIAARPTAARRSRMRIYRAMGAVEVQDQLAGVAWLRAPGLSSIRDRLAVYGWSYGGYMTLKLLEAGARHLRRRRRRRAGDALGAVRHPLYRALSRQSGDRSGALSGGSARSPMPAGSPIRCC